MIKIPKNTTDMYFLVLESLILAFWNFQSWNVIWHVSNY